MLNFVHERDFLYPNCTSKCIWPSDAESSKPHRGHRTSPNCMEIRSNILECIGNTPLVRLNNLPKLYGIQCEILAKCEFLGPGGSVKDRIGYRMVLDAEYEGKLVKGRTTIIEPTSGNTGIGMALASAVRGYKCVIVMPEKMSGEKVNVLRNLGAKIIRTPTEEAFDSPRGLISIAQKLCKETPDSIILNQYTNAGNPLAHCDGTASEILEQCDGHLNVLVCGAGTGGTVTGIGRKLKEKNPTIRIVAVDPHGSILAQPEQLNKNMVSVYQVEGIGYDFIPAVLDRSIIDEWIKTTDKDAFQMARQLIKHEGFLCGGSSGAAMHAAIKVAKSLNKTDRLVVILPDNIRNYLSKYALDDWMYAWDFFDPPVPLGVISDDLLTKFISKPTLLPNTGLKKAIEFMQQNELDYVPIVTENKIIEGVLTLKNIMKRVLETTNTNESLITSTDLLNNNVVERLYRKIYTKIRLDQLVRHLQSEPFVIFLDDNDKYAGTATIKDISSQILEPLLVQE